MTETMTDKQEDVSDWLNAEVHAGLPENKGTVSAIQPPIDVETKFGLRKKCTIIVNGSDGSTINIGLFLPQAFPLVHPKSNLAKILAENGCKSLKELIGKEVEVVQVGDMIWKLKQE